MRKTKPFAVERRAIKPRQPDWRQDHDAWKAQQQQRKQADIQAKVSEVEAVILRWRTANDPDVMRADAEKLVNVRHVEKVADYMEPYPNGVFVHAKPGCIEQLKLRMTMALSLVPMGTLDTRMPNRPRGLRPWVKQMGKP
jgi:putative heme degradation protein